MEMLETMCLDQKLFAEKQKPEAVQTQPIVVIEEITGWFKKGQLHQISEDDNKTSPGGL